MQAVLSFRNFSFRYKSQSQATLTDIHLDIYQGEKIWIAGPSGSGKSTLAHCINGLIPFSYGGEVSGQLLIYGQDAAKHSIFERSHQVGTILQNPDAQFVGLTVGEDAAFQMENEAWPQEEMKIKVISALELVGMAEYEGKSPHELSGGQKQSVSLAGVLSTQADILLFDEPLANLDPKSGMRTMELIDEIHRKTGKTVIIIEHRVEDVLSKSVDRIIIINDGKVRRVGTPDELLRSGVLPEYGLRQPLYLDALAYAEVPLELIDDLSTPDGIRVKNPLQDRSAVSHSDAPEEHKAHTQRESEIPNVMNNGSVFTEVKEQLERWMENVQPHLLPGSSAKLLELRGVSFAYESGTDTIHDLSFSIGQGETVALLGRNGAGKSTLSSLITGLLRPRAGAVLYQGEDMAKWSIRRRGEDIGYVMQNPNHMITQHMIKDEIELGLKARGLSPAEREQRTAEALNICGLYPYRNWPVSALSFGQKKRLSIAAILALQPRLMILDEPTAGQDYRHYTEFMEFIARLSAQGMAFLFITHDMHLALEYADRAVVMAGGRIIAEDFVANVLSDSFVAEQAHLRETSLSRFARSFGLSSPSRFVEAFIEREKVKKGR